MIAAAFENGLVVYHIGLPVIKDATSKIGFKALPEPTQGTGIAQAPLLSPVVACRWQGKHDDSSVSWVDYGPQNGLCLAMAMRKSDGGGAHMVLGTIDLPLYRQSIMSGGAADFRMLASTMVATESEQLPTKLLRGAGISSVYSVSEKFLMRTVLADQSVMSPEGMATALSHPVASQPPGLTASGDPLLVDTPSDSDGVLHIFNLLQCERKASKKDASLLEWSPPLLRHWLIRTVVGDTKKTSVSEDKEDRGFGSSDDVAGGAVSDVVCELYHEGLVGMVPIRITRCRDSTLCAIAYKKLLSNEANTTIDASLDATALAIVDCGANESHLLLALEVVPARDVAFFPSDKKESRGVLLSEDGSSLTYFTRESGSKCCKLASSFRPIVGVSINKEFVDCRRFYAFSGSGKVVFASVGTRPRDRRSCFVIGELGDAETLTEDNWSDRIPNIIDDRVSWFEEDEEVLSVIGLEGDGSGYRNFAVATSCRVLILSSGLRISAEVRPSEPCSALAPVGPFAVSYACRNKLHYLCCLETELSSGFVCNLPLRKHGCSQSHLLAVRPDRLLLMENHTGARFVEYGQNPNSLLLPTATTWPALLLEPLVANAICVGGKQSRSVPMLRTVIEKFGRKLASISHGDNEGIGQHGAGLTHAVFEMLRKYGLLHASSWLLTGTVTFDRTANSTILPPWLPVASKSVGGLHSDAFLHVISNGDQYFSDYVKSPDQSAASTLPRPSDPAAYLCREYAARSLREGRSSDALKMLDFAGCDTTETIAVQLALLLEKGSSRDATGILKLVSGYNADEFSSVPAKAPSCMAAVATYLKESKKREDPMTDEQVARWMRPLAPTLQRGTRTGRTRQRIAAEADLVAASGQGSNESDPLWVSPCVEAKHVWYVGLPIANTQRNKAILTFC